MTNAYRSLALMLGLGVMLTGGLARAEEKTYGDGVTLTRAVPIASLLEAPDTHAGKTVRVDGVVTKVCQMMGCWIEIADPAIGRGVRFKAEDGVIVFPKDAPGRKVSAQGRFEPIEGATHAAHGKSDDSIGKPAAATPTEKIYWVRVTGAVLH